MSDDQRPDVPDSAGETGVQRALGERRRRRLAERSGQVDLDATMSHWPVTDPPTVPRPVVRPARPTVDGVATEPVLPTPGQLVVGPLVEARQTGGATGPTAASGGGRRSRRRAAAAPTADGVPGAGPEPSADSGTGQTGTGQTGATTILAGGSTGARPAAAPGPAESGPVAPAGPAGGGLRSRRRSEPPEPPEQVSPFPATPTPTPSPVRPGRRGEQAGSQSRGATSRRRLRLSWPPGPLELVLAAAALAVVLLVVVLVVNLVGGTDDDAALQPSSGAATQQTSAITLSAPDGGVSAAAVLGVDPAGLSTLLLPADLLLTVADAEVVPLSQAVALGPDAVRRGLEDTLLLRVDQVVLLEPQQLADLVDAAGGVVLDVATQVVTDDVVVAAGDDQRLTGAQAVAYATLQVEDEPVEAGLARFGGVLAALLGVLPQDQDAAATSLAAAQVAVGAGAEEPEALPALMAAAAQRSASGDAQAVVLPTTEVTAGQADLRGVDTEAVEAALGTRFAGAQLPVAAVGDVRVVVRNGTGGSGLVGAARDMLVEAGLRYAGGGNAAQFGQPTTAVLVASEEPDDRAQGEAVALALGVPEDALQLNPEAMVDIDVIVVLGEDFDAGDDPSNPTEPTPGDLP